MTDYGLNWNRAMGRCGVEGQITPDTKLDGMQDLARYYPIDQVGEMFGITRDNANNLSNYIGKGIEKNAQAIQVVDEHFRGLGMPIPGGFIKYQTDYIATNGYREEVDVLKIIEQTGKTLEDLAEEKKLKEIGQTEIKEETKEEIKEEIKPVKKEIKKGVPTPRGLMMIEFKELTGKKPSPRLKDDELKQKILVLKQERGLA